MNTKVLTIALGVIMLASCGKKDNAEEAAAKGNQKVQVKIAQVHAESIPQTETYTATVESDVKNNISPNMPLRIKSILVEVGDYVHKGQVVAYLDETTGSQASMQIKMQEANIKSAEAQLENQKAETRRMQELYQAGGISKSSYEATETQLKVLQMSVEAAKAQLRALQAQASQSAENNRLVSPVSGVVTARNYDNGDMTGSLPVLTIEQTNPVKLKVNISEEHYKDVALGEDVSITLDAYEGEEFQGKVTIITPSVDASTHTFPVEITVTNTDQKVRPGMFARATVNFGNKDHVLVPDDALVKQIGAGDRYVYVYDAKSGTVSYNRVDLGKHIDKNYEIISGVKSGDQVVIAGQARLANGKAVEVVK